MQFQLWFFCSNVLPPEKFISLTAEEVYTKFTRELYIDVKNFFIIKGSSTTGVLLIYGRVLFQQIFICTGIYIQRCLMWRWWIWGTGSLNQRETRSKSRSFSNTHYNKNTSPTFIDNSTLYLVYVIPALSREMTWAFFKAFECYWSCWALIFASDSYPKHWLPQCHWGLVLHNLLQ